MRKQDQVTDFRALAKMVVDRIARDTRFRRRLLDNPAKALEAAGFDQASGIVSMLTSLHVLPARPCAARTCPRTTCLNTCNGRTCDVTCKVTR